MDANEQWMRSAWQAVLECREAQKAFFQMPNDKNRLKLAKVREARVDDILKLLLKAELIKPMEQVITAQSNLFK